MEASMFSNGVADASQHMGTHVLDALMALFASLIYFGKCKLRERDRFRFLLLFPADPVEQSLINKTCKCSCDARLSDSGIRMHIELLLLGSLLGSLAIVIKLTGRLQRSWVERDLRVGDLRALSNIAFRRIDGPAFDQIERLCKRGFLRMAAGRTGRMTLKGWVAVLFRNTSARRERAPTGRAPV
jgi:hypothetical protein